MKHKLFSHFNLIFLAVNIVLLAVSGFLFFTANASGGFQPIRTSASKYSRVGQLRLSSDVETLGLLENGHTPLKLEFLEVIRGGSPIDQ